MCKVESITVGTPVIVELNTTLVLAYLAVLIGSVLVLVPFLALALSPFLDAAVLAVSLFSSFYPCDHNFIFLSVCFIWPEQAIKPVQIRFCGCALLSALQGCKLVLS